MPVDMYIDRINSVAGNFCEYLLAGSAAPIAAQRKVSEVKSIRHPAPDEFNKSIDILPFNQAFGKSGINLQKALSSAKTSFFHYKKYLNLFKRVKFELLVSCEKRGIK